MKDTRRGFFTTVGVAGAALAFVPRSAQGAAPAPDSVLLAMPGDLYYAVPQAQLEAFAVTQSEFEAEIARRAALPALGTRGPTTVAPTPGPVAMGVRG